MSLIEEAEICEVIMEFTIFILFVVTTAIVVLSPGPAALTVTAQGAANGYLAAIFGIIGVASANIVYFTLSALGIASLIIASHTLFVTIKWIGVAYLVYLGLTAIFGKSGGIHVEKTAAEKGKALYMKGFIVEFANPKACVIGRTDYAVEFLIVCRC